MLDEAAQALLRRRAKSMMRRRARGLRASLPSSAVAARSALIVERLLAYPAIGNARDLASFWPMTQNHEVDLRALHVALRLLEKRVYYPAIEPGDGGRMRFLQVIDPAELVDRGKGFSEPADDAPAALRLDVVLVPGLSFDTRGHRLGYGAGHYDRALPRFCPPAIAIGVAFEFQLAPELPNTDGDVPVNVVITDARTLAATDCVPPSHG
ncbi:MAG: 5-formyltetrahydrofolate cyclo-ligase [Myxococcales bacterium]|nr:5-formyltetrahydrofolate cyclo-ligase [Myxococcales bacterium]